MFRLDASSTLVPKEYEVRFSSVGDLSKLLILGRDRVYDYIEVCCVHLRTLIVRHDFLYSYNVFQVLVLVWLVCGAISLNF